MSKNQLDLKIRPIVGGIEKYYGNKICVVSSLGALYVNVKEKVYPLDISGERFIINPEGPKKINISIPEIIKKEEFPNKVEYIIPFIDRELINDLEEPLYLSDQFLKYLILKYRDEKALSFSKELIEEFNEIISREDIYDKILWEDAKRFLKPTFVRFKKMQRGKQTLIKMWKKLNEKRKFPSVIKLYDVYPKMEDGNLELLSNFKVNLDMWLTDENNSPEDMKCISIGAIEKFDLVSIYIKNNRIEKIVLNAIMKYE
mgnify:CR=1 FL=1